MQSVDNRKKISVFEDIDDRKLEVSDKFAPRSAQMGTIGRVMNIKNMPYLEDEVVNTQ